MSGQVTDIPDPDLDQLQQRPPEITGVPNVPVEIVGTPRVLQAPNRSWSVSTLLLTTSPQHVVGDEPNRAVVTLCADADWLVATHRQTAPKRWPANVPLVLTHNQEVFASTATGSPNLTIIAEYHAD